MLEELELQEDYPSNFDMEHFKSLPSYKARLDYANSILKKLGSGSSRTVYEIDDQKVLKLAKNKKGLAQNEQEYNLGHDDYYLQGTVADVFDANDDFQWIESERAYKVKPTTFKKITGVDINDLSYYLTNFYDENNGKKPKFSQSKELVDFLRNNEFVMKISDVMMTYEMLAGDLGRLSSYGVVKRDGVEDIILIDYGVNNDIGAEVYGFKENHDKLRNIVREIVENEISDIKYKISEDEDTYYITAFSNNEKIGKISLDIMQDAYNMEFSDFMEEDEFNDLYPKDKIVKVSHIDVNDNYKNSGIGKELMLKALKLMKNKGYTEFYLNASPMGYRGLNLNDLVNFYKKFGFKEILHQGNNVLMSLVF